MLSIVDYTYNKTQHAVDENKGCGDRKVGLSALSHQQWLARSSSWILFFTDDTFMWTREREGGGYVVRAMYSADAVWVKDTQIHQGADGENRSMAIEGNWYFYSDRIKFHTLRLVGRVVFFPPWPYPRHFTRLFRRTMYYG